MIVERSWETDTCSCDSLGSTEESCYKWCTALVGTDGSLNKSVGLTIRFPRGYEPSAVEL